MFLVSIALGVALVALGWWNWSHPGDLESSAKDKGFYIVHRRSGSVVAVALGLLAIGGGFVQAVNWAT